MFLQNLTTTFQMFSSAIPSLFHNKITKNGIVSKLSTFVNKCVKQRVYKDLYCELNMN